MVDITLSCLSETMKNWAFNLTQTCFVILLRKIPTLVKNGGWAIDLINLLMLCDKLLKPDSRLNRVETNSSVLP